MCWKPTWPFGSRDHALVHEQAYLEGSYSPQGCRGPIELVKPVDLEREKWLEQEGAERLHRDTNDTEVIECIYLWKMQTTQRHDRIPPDILSDNFARILDEVNRSGLEEDVEVAMNRMIHCNGSKVRAASAFIYWLRPDKYQVIDIRVTRALGLQFDTKDYTPQNYLKYCQSSRHPVN